MTGRELIVYILENHLEDSPVCENGKFIGFMTVGEAAEKMNVGIATIVAWIGQKKLDAIVIGNTIYIPINSVSPMETNHSDI